jgi:hypothetical protein
MPPSILDSEVRYRYTGHSLVPKSHKERFIWTSNFHSSLRRRQSQHSLDECFADIPRTNDQPSRRSDEGACFSCPINLPYSTPLLIPVGLNRKISNVIHKQAVLLPVTSRR